MLNRGFGFKANILGLAFKSKGCLDFGLESAGPYYLYLDTLNSLVNK